MGEAWRPARGRLPAISGENVRYSYWGPFILALLLSLVWGCSSFQPTKNVWKTTKGLWNTYVSPPAYVDYEDKGNLSGESHALATATMGIDVELTRLERVMQNADRPPTQDWLNRLFANFPWLNGFAGVKYDGTILGQEPPDSMKQLDFIPLLYEDKKQNSRALRADVQPSPLGPEVMLAAPLYDGMDFLGIVVAYFDMRSLMRFSRNPEDIVVLSPGALLWAGKYDFGATPLAGVDWAKVVRESTAGVCSNSTGSFVYLVRYLGNLPLVFAIPSKGTFPEGNGDLAQGAAFFPQEREKLPPPTLPERKSEAERNLPVFEKEAPEEPVMETPQVVDNRPAEASDRNVIPAGSRDSMLLKGGRGKARRQVQERSLEGENVEVIRTPERRRRPVLVPEPELPPDEEERPQTQGSRPSPFGPREEPARAYQRPSPFGPREPQQTPSETESGTATGPAHASPQTPGGKSETSPAPQAQGGAGAGGEQEAAQPQTEEKSEQKPATLPGGRPSPFGPK